MQVLSQCSESLRFCELVLIENVCRLITFFSRVPRFLSIFGTSWCLSHTFRPRISPISWKKILLISGLRGWMNRFWKPRRRSCFLLLLFGWGEVQFPFCGGVKSLSRYFLFSPCLVKYALVVYTYIHIVI